MKIIFFVATLLLTSLLVDGDLLPTNQPKFINLSSDYSLVAKSEKVFSFNNPDTLLSHDMFLLKSADDLPLMYYSDIQTPVCIDNLCKPVFIEMYWDLMGNYAGYGEFSDEKLSKFDHDNFEKKDYEKLHGLLGDAHSIMGKRPLHSLYDISLSRDLTIKFKGVEVDGVSGATRKEIKTEIVDGALYSCHKLWRIAHGAAVPMIQKNLSSIYSDRLGDHLLESSHQEYHMQTVERLPVDQMEEKIEPLAQVLRSANAMTRSYILKKLPKPLFSHPVIVQELFDGFSSFDNNSKTIIVANSKHTTALAVLSLANQISHMSKNQLKDFLTQIKNTESLKSDALSSRLNDPSLAKDCIYYYLIQDYLEAH